MGEELVNVARGTEAGLFDAPYASGSQLSLDGTRKIGVNPAVDAADDRGPGGTRLGNSPRDVGAHLVAAGADGRSDTGLDILGPAPHLPRHDAEACLDHAGHDAAPSGVSHSGHVLPGIAQEDRGAVAESHQERYLRGIGDQRVGLGSNSAAVLRADDVNCRAMHLPGTDHIGRLPAQRAQGSAVILIYSFLVVAYCVTQVERGIGPSAHAPDAGEDRVKKALDSVQTLELVVHDAVTVDSFHRSTGLPYAHSKRCSSEARTSSIEDWT